MNRRSFAALLVVLSFASAARAEANAEKPEPPIRSAVEILVDASSAMGAATGKERTLLDEALEGVRSALAGLRLPSSQTVSVRLLGGSTSERCEAASVVPAGASAGPLLDEVAKRLKARGARPLAAGLVDAAGAMPRGESSFRTTIVVTAGMDGCGRDACAAADELRRELGLGQVRVVALGATRNVLERARCLGEVVVATDAATVGKQVRELVEAAFEPARVTLVATVDGSPVEAALEVRAAADEVPIRRASTGTVRLPGGTYQVRVSRDGAKGIEEATRRNLRLTPGSEVTVRVPLVASLATVRVTVRLNGEDAPMGTRIAAFRPGDTSREIGAGFNGEAITVPAGRYDLRATIPSNALAPIEVWRPEVLLRAGENAPLELDAVQPLGGLSVRVTSSDEELEEVAVLVLPPGSREETDVFVHPGIEAQLPEGRYTLLARYETSAGPLSKFRDDVVVKRGEPTEVTIELGPTGRVVVDVAGRGAEWGANVGVVKPGRLEIAGWVTAGDPLVLPVGKWDLLVESLGPLPLRTWVRGVEVTPGRTNRVRVPMMER